MPNEMAISALTEAPDSILVAASKRGERGTFRVLVERYQAKIFSVALHVTRNREDAEDVVQQSFQKAFIHLHAFEGKSSFSTWLTRIVINEALMIPRKTRALTATALDDVRSDHKTEFRVEISDASLSVNQMKASVRVVGASGFEPPTS